MDDFKGTRVLAHLFLEQIKNKDPKTAIDLAEDMLNRVYQCGKVDGRKEVV